MLNEGVIDRNVRYTPVLEGLTRPGYFQWYFDPITHFPVISHNEATCRDFTQFQSMHNSETSTVLPLHTAVAIALCHAASTAL